MKLHPNLMSKIDKVLTVVCLGVVLVTLILLTIVNLKG